MQQCGFSASAAAHDGVCAARLKFGGNAVQDLRVWCVAEGDVLKSDAVLQSGQLDGAFRRRILFQRLRELGDERPCRLRLNFSSSSARLFSANSRKISFFAWKVLTTGKPSRQSRRAAVKSRFRAETRASAACSRFPVRMDAASGRSISPAATAVSSGEYHSIMPSAPRNVTSFVMTESCWERKSVSMLPASLVSAER